MITPGSAQDRGDLAGISRRSTRIAVILSGSRRDQLKIAADVGPAVGVVVELSILPVDLRRAAEVVAELRGRRRGVAALRRCPSSRRGRRRAAGVVVGLSLFLAVVRRRSEPEVIRIAASPNNNRARCNASFIASSGVTWSRDPAWRVPLA